MYKVILYFIISLTILASTFPKDLDIYLKEKESIYDDIIKNTEKKIFWYKEHNKKTKYSIVYLHGFSATRQEVYPLANEIAKDLKANLFYTRYTGHGRPGKYLGEAKKEDWKNDTTEAIEIGKEIGEKVIVISTSTGGTLVTWYAMESIKKNKDLDNIVYILISPNYKIKDKNSILLEIPIIRYLIVNFFIKEQSWQGHSDEENRYWTTRYPSKVLIEMSDLVKEVRNFNFNKLKQPFFIIHSNNDDVVNTDIIDKKYNELGSKNKKLLIIPVKDYGKHVLAGDIMAPNNTVYLKNEIIKYLKNL
ncbi:esterase/lipase [Hypnocyclicus thermotrophus]|uniref:Esterase/lipase n=1 Tax=Hypnocyclicus thermotrophus TaxID=1627895 RepID=A0AA46DYX4_9FUSO|nr:alpha/beta hydrolase [Hypnocyclicus thermotrophus]TDT71378.1 esterase/lipase [Hypnocyclicus thermotrophus]